MRYAQTMVQASRILLVTVALTIPLFSDPGHARAQQLEEPPAPPPNAPIDPPPPPPPPMAEPAAAPPPMLPERAPLRSPPPPVEMMPMRPYSPLPPQVTSRWRAGRTVFAVGNVVGLLGAGLSLSGLVVIGIYKPTTDTGQIGVSLLAGGAAATGAGVILSATGLGLQHSALASIGEDPGRGLYAAGTVVGVLGLLSVGVGQFFRHTDYGATYPYAGFVASLGSAALLGVSGVLYLIDGRRMARVYRRLTTF